MPGETKKACPRCGRLMEGFAAAWGWGHCAKCSAELREEDKLFPFGRCKNCNREFNSELISEYGIEYCPWCGTKID